MQRFLLSFVGLSLVMCGCGGEGFTFPKSNPGAAQAFVLAAQGGQVRLPDAAVLVVPPGALSRDAKVTLRDLGYRGLSATDLFLPLSRAFSVNLGGAKALKSLELRLKYSSPELSARSLRGTGFWGGKLLPFDLANLLLRATDSNGGSWIHGVALRQKSGWAACRLLADLNQPGNLKRAFEVVYVPDFSVAEGTSPILQVPFYRQAGLPWCVPTTASMLANFHELHTGPVSNWQMAGGSRQDETEGSSVYLSLRAIGLSSFNRDWEFNRWDADLVPNNPFTDYLKRQVQGFNLQDLYGEEIRVGDTVVPVPDEDIPPRPVALESEALWHAFMGVGADDASVYIHDGGTEVIARAFTWEEFRNFSIVEANTEELATTVLNWPGRPETERRGSIVLHDNAPWGYYFDNSSLFFEDGRIPYNEGNTSRWQWDGDPYENGTYWDDPYDIFPDHETYGNSLFLDGAAGSLPGRILYELYLANVTDRERVFHMRVELTEADGTVLDSRETWARIPAYSFNTSTSYAYGEFNTSCVTRPGVHRIVFILTQNSVVQDVKSVEFHVIDDPLPGVQAEADPVSGIVPLLVDFTAQAGGGVPPLGFAWDFDDGSPAGTIQNPSHIYQEAGNYDVTVTVTDQAGNTASSTVRITARDPAPNLAVKPGFLEFGSVPVGTATDRNIQIKNEGEGALGTLMITEISYDGPSGFTVSAPAVPLELGPQESRNINVQFLPSLEANYTGFITIRSNDPNLPVTEVILHGVGGEPGPVLWVTPSQLIFNETLIEDTVSVRNNGTGVLPWSVTDDLPGWLRVTPMSGSATPENPSEVAVRARSAGLSVGTYTHNIKINGSDRVLAVLVLSSPPPELQLDPPELDFGETQTGGSFEIRNNGGAPLFWTAVTAGKPNWLNLVSAASGETPAGGTSTVTLNVSRNLLTPGVYAYSLPLFTNGGDGSVEVKMTVPGQTLRVTPAEVDFGPAGVTDSILLENTGGFTLNWVIADDLPAWLSAEPLSGALEPGASVEVGLSVDRTGLPAGAYSQTIQVASNGGSATVEARIEVPASDVPEVTAWAEPLTGPAPLTVQFFAEVTGGDPPLSFQWVFGDEYTSPLQNPTHVYLWPGTFRAQVAVTDADGDYDMAEVWITVEEIPTRRFPPF